MDKQAPGRVFISQGCRTRSVTSNSALGASQRRVGGGYRKEVGVEVCVCVCV